MQTLYTHTYNRRNSGNHHHIQAILSTRFVLECLHNVQQFSKERKGKNTTERRTIKKQKGWKRYGTKEHILGERNVQLFFTLNRQMGIHIEGKMETEKGSAAGAGIISASRKRQWWRLWRWYLEKTTNTWCVVYVCSRRWTFRCSFRLLFFFY